MAMKRRKRQVFRVAGLTSGPLTHALGQELLGLDGVREVEIEVDSGGLSTVVVVASRLLEAPEFEAAVDQARGQFLVAS